KLDENVRKFCTDLLNQVRSRNELSTMLNYDPNGSPWAEGDHHSLERLKLAIKHGQKGLVIYTYKYLYFVAHSNVQQLLGSIWYDGLPGFRRKSDFKKTIEILKLAFMFPLFSLTYIINPESSRGQFMKKPFVTSSVSILVTSSVSISKLLALFLVWLLAQFIF
ncbi:Transient-receptor-potential-like protein, partial [Armadillidium vulgare]